MANNKIENTRKEGWDIMISSAQAYDKSIISLSTVSLGFIFAISKNPDSTMGCKIFLIFVAILLILSVVFSLLSFWFDQMFGLSIRKQADAQNKIKKGCSYYAALYSKILSGLLFIFSLVLYTVYYFNNSFLIK